MRIEHAFEAPATVEATLDLLLDAERVIPCMPGARLVEVVDERTWKAAMSVKLGPVGMEFRNDVRLLEVDRDAGTARLGVSGRDTRGKGGAEATVDSTVTAIEGGARVAMVTDLRFSGQAAQLGRPNVVQDVSNRMVGQFADCIRAQLSAEPERAAAAIRQAARPVSGVRLALVALWNAIRGIFRGSGAREGGAQ